MREFQPSDLDEMNGWYRSRGETEIPLLELPRIGFIEPGVAAGFVMMTDGVWAILECFIANPDADSIDRDEALDSISESCLNAAREHGHTRALMVSRQGCIEQRARRHGFNALGRYTLMHKDMTIGIRR